MDNLSCKLKGNADGVAHRRTIGGVSHIDNTQTSARLDNDASIIGKMIMSGRLKTEGRCRRCM